MSDCASGNSSCHVREFLANDTAAITCHVRALNDSGKVEVTMGLTDPVVPTKISASGPVGLDRTFLSLAHDYLQLNIGNV